MASIGGEALTAESLAHELGGRKVGATWMGKCPAHDDHSPSLAIRDDGGMLLFNCHAGCGQAEVVAALKGRGLWPERTDLPYRNGSGKNGHSPSSDPPKPLWPAENSRRKMAEEGWVIAAEYSYSSTLRNVRFENPSLIDPDKGRPEKTYKWEHFRDGKWYSGDGGLTKPVYLNAVCRKGGQFDCILGLEGPNKAEAAAELGIPAFSFKNLNEESGKELSQFRGVAIWRDNDSSGLKFAETAAKLLGPYFRDVRMIDPPSNLPDAGDIIDAVAMGMDADGVRALMDGARRISSGPVMRAFTDIPLIGSFAGRKIDWIVEDLIAAGTITIFSGDSGAGKSTVATAMLGAIACGQPFLGRETQQRPVMILDRENPLSVVDERLQRLRMGDGECLRFWGGWCPEEAPALNSPILTEIVASFNPRPVILIDSLNGFNDGNENDAGETRTLFTSMRRLADAGATIIVLHHSGKSETARDYRGSSDIKASIDIGYKLTNLGDGSQLSLLQLKAFKQRISVTSNLMLRYFDGTFQIEDGEIHKTVTQRLRELLQENPGGTKTEFEKLAHERGLGRNRARDFIDTGLDHGTIRGQAGNKNATLHFWCGPSSNGDA